MIAASPTVFLVDDDPAVLKALCRLLTAKGYEVRSFCSPQLFVDQHDASIAGCAVLDVAMPGLNGLQLQSVLAAGAAPRPVIFLTGRGDVPTSVTAMKAGAVDFLSKPVRATDLMLAVERALERDARARSLQQQAATIDAKLSHLTPREHQVLRHVISGRLNKQIAFELGTVVKTIKVHRGRMMKKLGVRTLVELLQLAERAGITPASTRTDHGGRGP
jgi:FixJ family two-component response regulator